jgi:hypothetical protein
MFAMKWNLKYLFPRRYIMDKMEDSAEFVRSLVSDNNNFTLAQAGWAIRRDKIRSELYSKISEGKGSVISVDEELGIAIIELYASSHKDNPYTGSIRQEDGTWKKTSHLYPNYLFALLSTIGFKMGGMNSQWGRFAYNSIKED